MAGTLMQLQKVLLDGVQVLSDIVQRAALREGQHVALDLQISAYVDDAGASDRIQKTCIPQSYTRHTSRELEERDRKLQSFHYSPGPQ